MRCNILEIRFRPPFSISHPLIVWLSDQATSYQFKSHTTFRLLLESFQWMWYASFYLCCWAWKGTGVFVLYLVFHRCCCFISFDSVIWWSCNALLLAHVHISLCPYLFVCLPLCVCMCVRCEWSLFECFVRSLCISLNTIRTSFVDLLLCLPLSFVYLTSFIFQSSVSVCIFKAVFVLHMCVCVCALVATASVVCCFDQAIQTINSV